MRFLIKLLRQPASMVGVCVVLATTSAQAQQGDFNDLAARLEYAFYAGDISTLQRTLTTFEQLDLNDERRGAYLSYLNYGRWKFAQLAQASASKDQISKDQIDAALIAARKCSSDANTKLSAQDQAEQLALASACALMLETLRPVRGLLYRGERADKLQHALEIAADNPQVGLVAYWELSLREEASTEHLNRVKSVAKRYEAVGNSLGSTRWGSAEAWYLLAMAQWERKDVLAARDAIEQALLQAPDYRDAQILMKKMSLSH
jgi:hypothetical protein